MIYIDFQGMFSVYHDWLQDGANNHQHFSQSMGEVLQGTNPPMDIMVLLCFLDTQTW